jgi:hypothetical protein
MDKVDRLLTFQCMWELELLDLTLADLCDYQQRIVVW